MSQIAKHFDMKLPAINELYTCIQGEGSLTGIPHLLIRTTGCSLRCQFKNSFCDTWYSSWKPEKSAFGATDIISIIRNNPQITHTMVTGGGPTMHGERLKNLCTILQDYEHWITLETEGSEFVKDCPVNLLSLSPKLKSSVPRLGADLPFNVGKKVTQKDIDKHEKNRCNYAAMRQWIAVADEIQVKFVTDGSMEDMDEIDFIIEKLYLKRSDVWLMPVGETEQKLQASRKKLESICILNGFNYTDRLHIIIHGDKRNV